MDKEEGADGEEEGRRGGRRRTCCNGMVKVGEEQRWRARKDLS